MTAPRLPRITVYPPEPPAPSPSPPPVVVDIRAEVTPDTPTGAPSEVTAGKTTAGVSIAASQEEGIGEVGAPGSDPGPRSTPREQGSAAIESATVQGKRKKRRSKKTKTTRSRASSSPAPNPSAPDSSTAALADLSPSDRSLSTSRSSAAAPSEFDRADPQEADLNPDLSSPPPTPPQLRPYQADVINGVYAKVREGFRRIVIIAGTGAGKTVISGQICAHAEARGSKLLFLVHLDVLVGQTYAKMQSFGLHCGFIKAGWPEDPSAPIQIASVQTMAKRDWWQTWPADLIFYDEGHTTAFSQVGQQVLYETHPHAVHIAMTATPYRLGDEQLGDHFETFVAAPPPMVLQKMGFLAPMQYYGLALEDQIDLEGIQTVAGDYDEKGLKNACDRPELVARIVQEWQRLVPGKRTIAFCVDVDHARHVAAAFQQAGIPAETVDGGTPPKARQKLYQALASGDLLVLTSCNVISIGFDVPAVEVGLLLRPTLSLALHHQQIGRVMRISPATGKTHGIILDQAGNLQRLGFPEDVERYELPVGSAATPGESPGVPDGKPSKTCPQCQRCVAMVSMACPGCGYDWAADRPVYTEDLIQLLTREQIRQIDDEPTRYRFFQGLRRYFFRRNYGPGLVKQEYFDYFGCFPPEEWYQGAIFGKAPSGYDRQLYFEYLQGTAYRLGKSQDWIVAEFEEEFGPGSWG